MSLLSPMLSIIRVNKRTNISVITQYSQYRTIYITSIKLSSQQQKQQKEKQQKQQNVFRRTKRTNYADREHVIFTDSSHSTREVTTESISSIALSSSIALRETRGNTVGSINYNLNSSLLSHRDEAALRHSRLILHALNTPMFGRITYYTLSALSYLHYGVGRVSLYTRYSVAPPLHSSSSNSNSNNNNTTNSNSNNNTNSNNNNNTINSNSNNNSNSDGISISSTTTSSGFLQHLINVAAFEQAAAVATTTTTTTNSNNNNTDNINNINNNNNNNKDKNNNNSVGVSRFRGILQNTAIDALCIGRSKIHGRGIIAKHLIPRGTRIITTPQRTYIDAASFIPFLADTHSKLPDTWHYTHPAGVLLELVIQPLPHHLMNHSCDANVCCGLSREFWPLVMRHTNNNNNNINSNSNNNNSNNSNSNSNNTNSNSINSINSDSNSDSNSINNNNNNTMNELLTRMQDFPYFEDANSFFTTRDVQAGEELTLSYTHRVAPIFFGEIPLRYLHTICRCGAQNCRHFVYRPPDTVMRTNSPWLSFTSHNNNNNNNNKQQEEEQEWDLNKADGDSNSNNNNNNINNNNNNEIRWLLESGFDDETVMLSLLPSRAPLFKYMRRHLAPFRRTATKRELLMCYRHVFKLLNEAAPEEY